MEDKEIKDKYARYVAATNQEYGELNWTILSGFVSNILFNIEKRYIRETDGQWVFEIGGVEVSSLFFIDEKQNLIGIYDAKLNGFRNMDGYKSKPEIGRILFADNNLHGGIKTKQSKKYENMKLTAKIVYGVH